ncbi:hypothetical protein ThidrDRAFT_1794 [Thiorhodococcus drewsii AZ1]|uniref:Uncharacterized protein n=1 Tax=Thiorhodococcus drewsii AZ1 TaxID=765913 RepID=G2E0I1_9GAMM|nr:hypothetical protein [Thiorhodococcus drewsii]EGV31909.1 hypothetical protein ThidrDRAFT_1794 [Thiorhodococcus drewsii AZ1]
MALEFKKTTVIASDLLGVEDAEILLEWLIKHPRGRINLSACTHLHAANLQVLMAAKPKVSAWPRDGVLADWLRAALTP